MALALIPFLLSAATWLGRIGLAAFAVNEIKKLTEPQKDLMAQSLEQAERAGISEDEQKKMVAAVTYEKVEASGQDPQKFWEGLTPDEKLQLKYGPDSVLSSMERTSFLGTAQTLLWIGAAVALGYAAFRGLPVSVKGLADIAKLRQAGVAAPVIANELSILRTAILNKSWIPGSIAGILTAGGWLTGNLTNNMNDAFLWGPTFLDQAHSDVQKAWDNLQKGIGKGGGENDTIDLPKTIIRMTTEEKPKQFIGTLFSSKLGKAEQFERTLDDKITDMDDLEADVKINLNKWLASLPTRMGYSVVIRKDPVDEQGAQQSGVWATLTLFITHISGKTTPIDTILLGPVEPQVRLELQRKTTTVENQISGFVQAATVKEIQIPSGSVDIFNAKGERVTPSTVSQPTITSPVTATPTGQVQTAQAMANIPPPRTGYTRFIETSPGVRINYDNANTILKAAANAGTYKVIEVSDSGAVALPPTPAPTTPSKPRIGDRYVVANTGGTGVRLRAQPNLNARILFNMAEGTVVEFLKEEGSADGFDWWEVLRVSDRSNGSVASQFLKRA